MASNFEVPTNIKPFLLNDEPVFLSKMIGHSKTASQAQNSSQNFLNFLQDEDKVKHTYFDQKTKLNNSAMIEYQLKDDSNPFDATEEDDKDKLVDEAKLMIVDN